MELTDFLSHRTTWNRIFEFKIRKARLARARPDTTGLSRFREVLLRLQREGTSAPGTAGYSKYAPSYCNAHTLINLAVTC